ncbi:UNKNOWN [Stylonychia lemnae]|uniref:Uncharacterized protein n=1 Tax=Stylonychia lemnae TaxID=5949 RepID=A0A078B6U9_STYLE|nr:UNKNOWN [Stylonychia lemnae]|eukprot:CDW89911.1 UNKNOWN [Stylonychia lemnae]
MHKYLGTESAKRLSTIQKTQPKRLSNVSSVQFVTHTPQVNTKYVNLVGNETKMKAGKNLKYENEKAQQAHSAQKEKDDDVMRHINTSVSNLLAFEDHEEHSQTDIKLQQELQLPRSNILIKKPLNQSECNSPYITRGQNATQLGIPVAHTLIASESKSNFHGPSPLTMSNSKNSSPYLRANKPLYRNQSTFQIPLNLHQRDTPQNLKYIDTKEYETNNSSANIGEEKTLKDDQKEIKSIQLAQYAIQALKDKGKHINFDTRDQLDISKTSSSKKTKKTIQKNRQMPNKQNPSQFSIKTNAINSPKRAARLKKGKSESNLKKHEISKNSCPQAQQVVIQKMQQLDQSSFITPFDSEITSQNNNVNISQIHIDHDQEYRIMKPNKSPLLKKAQESNMFNQFEFDDDQHDFDVLFEQKKEKGHPPLQ